MHLAGQYTNKAKGDLQIQVIEENDNHLIVKQISGAKKNDGELLTAINMKPGPPSYTPQGSLILKTMDASPRNAGIGVILVYEYALLASRLNIGFLAIDLVANDDPTNKDPFFSPRPFYYKMGFVDTPATTNLQQNPNYSEAERARLALSLPMSGITQQVIELAAQSWKKKWERR